MQDALNIMEHARPQIDTLINALTYVLVKKDEKGVAELADFIKDAVILDKLTFVESDRLMNRFVRRCEHVGKKKNPEDVKEFFMNTIGEFTLISMGIIGQEIFTLQRSQLDNEAYEQARTELLSVGIDINQIVGSYRQRNEGGLFWNRWKTLGTRPSQITDERIRQFLTTTVRNDEAQVLDALDYKNMISRIQEINSDPIEDKEEKRQRLEELFVETFSADQFKKTLISLLKEKWYKKLEIFYSPSI
jgi:hypothetical protein